MLITRFSSSNMILLENNLGLGMPPPHEIGLPPPLNMDQGLPPPFLQQGGPQGLLGPPPGLLPPGGPPMLGPGGNILLRPGYPGPMVPGPPHLVSGPPPGLQGFDISLPPPLRYYNTQKHQTNFLFTTQIAFCQLSCFAPNFFTIFLHCLM